MKALRYFLCIALFLLAATGHTLLARASSGHSAFGTENEPDPNANASPLRVAVWLFTGVMLGWTLLSLYVTCLARQELVKALREE